MFHLYFCSYIKSHVPTLSIIWAEYKIFMAWISALQCSSSSVGWVLLKLQYKHIEAETKCIPDCRWYVYAKVYLHFLSFLNIFRAQDLKYCLVVDQDMSILLSQNHSYWWPDGTKEPGHQHLLCWLSYMAYSSFSSFISKVFISLQWIFCILRKYIFVPLNHIHIWLSVQRAVQYECVIQQLYRVQNMIGRENKKHRELVQ